MGRPIRNFVPRVLPKVVIENYLNRTFKTDCRTYKDLDSLSLERWAGRKNPPIWEKLQLHQKICLVAGADLKGMLYHLDTGMGKTLLSISLIKYFKGLVSRTLVLVPNTANKWEWRDEILKHAPETTMLIMQEDTEEKWRLLETTDAEIIVETYTGLMWMLCDKVPTKKKGKKHEFKPSPKKIKKMQEYFDGLVMDEITAATNHMALPFRLCRQLGKTAKVRFGLTGTPFGRNPILLWAQMYLCDKGETFGENIGLFREAFFRPVANFWGGVDYHFKKKESKTLHNMLSNRSLRYKASEADLPGLVPVLKYVSLPQGSQAYYDKFWNELQKNHGNYHAQQNSFLKMRQVSSGFLSYLDEDEEERKQMRFDENPKLEMLVSILKEIDPHKKVLVMHDFVLSGDIIAERLKDEKIGFVQLRGGGGNSANAKRNWEENPDCPVFIFNTAGAYGLNLQAAQYGIFYERPVSVIQQKQMIRRFERQFSEHDTVFLYDLVVRGTVDAKIIEFFKESEHLFNAVIEGQEVDTSERDFFSFLRIAA